MNMRIGVVPYLNALPLCRYLKRPVIFGTPIELTDRMERGELDIALLPSFAFFSLKNTTPIYEAGLIQSCGPVESVTLFLRRGIENMSGIKTIKYSNESVSSNILFKVLLKFLIRRDLSALREVTENPDGKLLIGDKALFEENRGGKKVDLGELWTDWTGLPFVYAMWVANRSVPKEIVNDLIAAKKEGLSRIDEIVASCRDLPPARLKNYLTQSIRYDMRSDSLRGLAAFQDYALRLGSLTEARKL